MSKSDKKEGTATTATTKEKEDPITAAYRAFYESGESGRQNTNDLMRAIAKALDVDLDKFPERGKQ